MLVSQLASWTSSNARDSTAATALRPPKTILLGTPWWFNSSWFFPSGSAAFSSCPVSNCYMTDNKSQADITRQRPQRGGRSERTRIPQITNKLPMPHRVTRFTGRPAGMQCCSMPGTCSTPRSRCRPAGPPASATSCSVSRVCTTAVRSHSPPLHW